MLLRIQQKAGRRTRQRIEVTTRAMIQRPPHAVEGGMFSGMPYYVRVRTPYEPARDAIGLPDVLHALSDPIRLRIVRELALTERVCGSLEFPIAKSTLSHHFRLLREAGVTHTRVDGVRRMVSLREADLNARFPGLLNSILAALG